MNPVSRRSSWLVAVLFAACSGGSGDDELGPDAGFSDVVDADDPTDCVPEVIEAPTAVACARATKTCLAGCETDECYETCLANDPQGEECGTCLEDGYIACVNAMGCQPQWDASSCCYARCPDPESAACETSCSTEDAAYDTCLEAYDEACTTSTDAICFPA